MRNQMKNILSITTWALLVITMFNACEQQYIDPITSVDPGADESAPEVVVNFPPNGYELQTNAEIASINIRFEVRDDIEIDNISVSLNGTEIASYNDFIDYRVAKMDFDYDNVTTGDHVLIVAATDLDGKTTEVNVNFSKSPPYVAAYDGEVFYMPFNGEYREMNSLDLATAKGTPGFAGSGNGIQHGNAYAGAADAYLTFPSAGLQGTNAVSATFWMKVDDTMDRAGILVAAPPADNNNDRTKGFRFFREASNGGATQRFKLNVGNGTADSWFDGVLRLMSFRIPENGHILPLQSQMPRWSSISMERLLVKVLLPVWTGQIAKYYQSCQANQTGQVGAITQTVVSWTNCESTMWNCHRRTSKPSCSKSRQVST